MNWKLFTDKQIPNAETSWWCFWASNLLHEIEEVWWFSFNLYLGSVLVKFCSILNSFHLCFQLLEGSHWIVQSYICTFLCFVIYWMCRVLIDICQLSTANFDRSIFLSFVNIHIITISILNFNFLSSSHDFTIYIS